MPLILDLMRRYHSVKFDVVEKRVKLPNGAEYTASIIVHKPVAVVIAVIDGKILLEKQYRHSVNRWLYELPAGFLQGRISLKKLAEEELHEETGYKANKLTFLFKAYAAVGTSTETYHYYLAEGLKKEKQHLEKYEMISVEKVGIKEVLRMIKQNKIVDGKTIQGVLYYYNFIASK
ncbi:MAG TPA: NUDIX hydrolase [Candidatus Acidoferrum sp.]|nr:NUDIX hydrolase [Candidatus Acidoferrum sp.]